MTISAVTAEASAVVTSTTKAIVVSAMVGRPVMATVVVTTAAAIAGEVARAHEPVHRKRGSPYRAIPLLADPRSAKDAPNHKHTTGHEPHQGRLGDLL